MKVERSDARHRLAVISSQYGLLSCRQSDDDCSKKCAAGFAEYRMAIWGGWRSFELRHAELVSASIQRPNALFNLEKWILKQVQDDIASNSKIWSSVAYALSTVCRLAAS